MAKTYIEVQWAVIAKTYSGKERTITHNIYSKETAEKFIEENKQNAKRYPEIYYDYKEYKIVKRTATHTYEDWEEA